jgi:hypothetical protein
MIVFNEQVFSKGCISTCRESPYLCQRIKTITVMTKEEYLALAMKRYDEFEALKSADNFYDYGKGFDKIWQDSGRQYMESYLNETSKTQDRRKKKLLPDSEK